MCREDNEVSEQFPFVLGVGGCQDAHGVAGSNKPTEPCLSFGFGYGEVCLCPPWPLSWLQFSLFLLSGASPGHNYLCQLCLHRLSRPPAAVQVILDGIASG